MATAKFMVLIRKADAPTATYEAAAKTFGTENAARKFAQLIESGKMSTTLVVRVCDPGQAIRAKHALASSIMEVNDQPDA